MSSSLSLVLLLAIRFGAVLRLIPFFSGVMPFIASVAFSLALSLAIAPNAGPPPLTPLFSGFWIALATRELFIGIAIGCLTRIAFAVFEVIGDLAQSATIGAPETTEMYGLPFTKLYALLGPVLFLLVGGHHAFISGLTASARSIPPAALDWGGSLAGVGLALPTQLFSTMMGTSILLAAPIFVAGLGADLFFGIAARFSTQQILVAPHGVLRLVVIELAVLASLGFAVTRSIAFLSDNVTKMTLASHF